MRNTIRKKLILAICFAAMLIGLMGACSQAASLPFKYTKEVRVEYKKGLQNRVKLWIEVKNDKYFYTKAYYDSCKKNFWEMTSSKASVAAKPAKSLYDKLGTAVKYGPLVQLKKPGEATMKYKVTINKKSYTCKTKVYVYEYSNPLKSLKLDGKEIKNSVNYGINATEVHCTEGEYSSGSKHTLKIEPAKGWSVKKIVAKNYNKSKTAELENGKSFSKKYDEIIITMKNNTTKVEKTIDILPY